MSKTLKPSRARELITRARSACKFSVDYKMGKGGFNPNSDSPADNGLCDCTGFVAWVLGISRKPKPLRPWWIESTELWSRSKAGDTFSRLSTAVPGCVAVWPDSHGHSGHAAIITEVRGTELYGCDCSSNMNGIAEHRLGYFERHSDTVFIALNQDLVKI